MSKLCPMKLSGSVIPANVAFGKCSNTECSWWYSDTEECAILTIASALGWISKDFHEVSFDGYIDIRENP